MKVLIVDTDNVGLSFAWRCAQAGHDVRWFVKPKPCNSPETGEGFKGVKRIDNWVGSASWADLVFVTSNDDYLEKLDFFKRKGVPVYCPSVKSANLEISRKTGMQLMEKVGIECAPYKTFKTMKEAEAYVRKTEERFVFKTLGDNEDKALTYVSKNPADLIGWMERIRKLKMEPKGEVMLQTFISGIEMGVSRWMGSKGWVGQYNESFEHKKLMSGNYGPNTGETGTVAGFVPESKLGDETLGKLQEELLKLNHLGDTALGFIIDEKGKPWPTEWTCYDKTTEVLTKTGWKLFKDVTQGELVATLNPKSGFMEYQPAVNVIEKPFNGEMIHFHGDRSAPDLMVTPDHAMWAMDGNKGTWGFQTAERVAKAGNWKIKRSANWVGEEVAEFTLPGYTEIHQLNMQERPVEIEHPPITMHMDTWLKFLGLYISEGSIGKKCDKGVGYQVNIAQMGHRKGLVRDALADFPIKATESPSGFLISSRQLCLYLHATNFGLCDQKFIPEILMHLSQRQLNILLDHLIMGDGTVHKRTGQRAYYSTSEKLAGQVQELILKTGGLGRVRKENTAGTRMSIKGGKTYTRNYDIYCVSERKKLVDGWLDRRLVEKVAYNDMVYCLNVPPHHLLYVRRNGNPSWCGNCRPGWPIFNMMLGSIKGDPAQWMLDAINGKDTTSFHEEVGTCLVATHGDFPHGNKPIEEVTGVPIYGVTKGNKKHLHPQGVKIEIHPDMENDKIVERPVWSTAGDYVMVITGFGKDVKQSAERAYKTVKQLHVSNMMVRDDVGELLEKQLPELHKHGYATHFEYDKGKQ